MSTQDVLPTVKDNLILDVDFFSKDDDGDWVVFCPHCHRAMGLEPGPIRGEQYQDRVCGGWLQVTFEARRVANIWDIGPGV